MSHEHGQVLLPPRLHAVQVVAQGEHRQRVDPTCEVHREAAQFLAGRQHGHNVLPNHESLLTQTHRLQVDQKRAWALQGRNQPDQLHPALEHLLAVGGGGAQVAAGAQVTAVVLGAQPDQELPPGLQGRHLAERSHTVALERTECTQELQTRRDQRGGNTLQQPSRHQRAQGNRRQELG